MMHIQWINFLPFLLLKDDSILFTQEEQDIPVMLTWTLQVSPSTSSIQLTASLVVTLETSGEGTFLWHTLLLLVTTESISKSARASSKVQMKWQQNYRRYHQTIWSMQKSLEKNLWQHDKLYLLNITISSNRAFSMGQWVHFTTLKWISLLWLSQTLNFRCT